MLRAVIWRNDAAKQEEEMYTLTILSANFINHDTRSPVEPRFNTTSHVVIVYPLNRRCHHGPFSNPLLKSSKTIRPKLNIAPNLEKKIIESINTRILYTMPN